MPDSTLTIRWLKRHIAEHHSKIITSLFSADEESLHDNLQIQAVDDDRCFATEEIPEVFLSESPYGKSCTDSQFNEFLSNAMVTRFKACIVLSVQKIMRFHCFAPTVLHRLNVQDCVNITVNGFQHLAKCSTLQVSRML